MTIRLYGSPHSSSDPADRGCCNCAEGQHVLPGTILCPANHHHAPALFYPGGYCVDRADLLGHRSGSYSKQVCCMCAAWLLSKASMRPSSCLPLASGRLIHRVAVSKSFARASVVALCDRKLSQSCVLPRFFIFFFLCVLVHQWSVTFFR